MDEGDADLAVLSDSADDRIAAQSVRAIVERWEALKGPRPAPRRADVDPVELFDFLPHLTMIRVIDDGRDFEFSLIGTGLSKLYGLVTRQRVSAAAIPDSARAALLQVLAACAESMAPVHAFFRNVATVKRGSVDIEMVCLPLSEDGRTVSRILGFHVFRH